MATNIAFEPDNSEDVVSSTISCTNNKSINSIVRQTQNESTTHLDTYFSDEKIIIPDTVSILQTLKY